MLRTDDALKVEKEDIRMNGDGKYELTYKYQRKRFNIVFSYTIPAVYNGILTRYLKELSPRKPVKGKARPRLLRNWNLNGKHHAQNAGRHTIDGVAKEAAKYLGKDPKIFSGHS